MKRKAARGTLFLASSPEGAAISVDGKRIGQVTPAQLLLRPGAHSIMVEKGQWQATERVEITNGITTRKIVLGEGIDVWPSGFDAVLTAIENGQAKKDHPTPELIAAGRALQMLTAALALMMAQPAESARVARAMREFEALETLGGKTN